MSSESKVVYLEDGLPRLEPQNKPPMSPDVFLPGRTLFPTQNPSRET